jgi:[ribosomal protein S5]-alanine N-acetyltransferase
MQNPFLIGTRVYLRPLERADVPLLIPWINDPEVTRGLRIHRPMNVQTEEEFIQKMYQDEHALAVGIALRETDQLVGMTGLHQMDFRNRHASFGLMIGAKDAWGRGYGTEATALLVRHAFETLNLNRVWLLVYEDNAAGIRAYEKVGFRKEGVLRQDSFHQGRYWDTFIMGVLREDWNAAR